MLPNNLKYMNKVESAPARQYTSTIQPINGTGNYGPNTKCIINIPTSRNTVLVPSESFLKFNISGVTNGANASNFIRLDKCGAHGVIQRLRVTHGSTQIEDIDNYGALVSMMMSLQQTTDSFSGKQNLLAGTECAQYVIGGLVSNAVDGGVVTNTATTGGVSTINCVGERLNQSYAQIAGYTVGPPITGIVPDRTYALNLLSYLGSLSGSQYIPLFEMTAAPLTLEIQFVSSALQFLCCAQVLAAGNPYTILNVEFIGTFIELSDESINIIRQSQMGQPLQYVIQSYANLTGSIPANTTSITLPIAAKYASLKSLFCQMRTNQAGAVTFFPYSAEHNNLSDWRIRIGSQILPAKAPNTMVEHYAELLKAIGSLSDINHEPTINWYNYAAAVTPVANTESTSIASTTKSNSFYLGFDVETYSNSNKDRIFAGMNTLNSDIFWILNFSAVTVALRADFFALFDQVIMFENGMVRVVK